METIALRPVEIEHDFGQLAALFTLEQGEPTTEPALKLDYEEHKDRIFRLMVAEDAQGELLGFNWATRSRLDPTQANFYIIVKAGQRRQGAGSQLYQDLEQAARVEQIKQLKITVRDDCPECRAFAEKVGFSKCSHSIGMSLDLSGFDEQPGLATIARLKNEGFQFTSMAALGNTEEVQRKLYTLNDMTSLETPGSTGEHNWSSFEDFQKKVCQAEWYKPAGQMLVIDSSSGDWAGMSAITRFEGVDYAYNLFTGVDKRYRGRKLAQAVKVLALCHAREVLKVGIVQTNHDSQNFPMIAIDRKLGYVQTPGYFKLVKILNEPVSE
jgi:RimJ/RimL family protein N-acetyltransferase/L-amino acid N-acyltransferase YncA